MSLFHVYQLAYSLYNFAQELLASVIMKNSWCVMVTDHDLKEVLDYR